MNKHSCGAPGHNLTAQHTQKIDIEAEIPLY